MTHNNMVASSRFFLCIFFRYESTTRCLGQTAKLRSKTVTSRGPIQVHSSKPTDQKEKPSVRLVGPNNISNPKNKLPRTFSFWAKTPRSLSLCSLCKTLISEIGNGAATVWAHQERDEAVVQVRGGSAVCVALQGRWLGGERSTEAEWIHKEPQASLQMGGRRHSQEASRTQALLPCSQGTHPQALKLLMVLNLLRFFFWTLKLLNFFYLKEHYFELIHL